MILRSRSLTEQKIAAGDEVSLDFGKPDFDLVEPRGVGGRVMNTHFGMTSQKTTDCLGLMRAQVITDDMHGLLLGLAFAGPLSLRS